MIRQILGQAEIREVNGSRILNHQLESHQEVAIDKFGFTDDCFGNSKVRNQDRRRIISECAVSGCFAVFTVVVRTVIANVAGNQYLA